MTGQGAIGPREDLGPGLAAADLEGAPLPKGLDLLREALDDLLHGEALPVADVDLAPGPVVLQGSAEGEGGVRGAAEVGAEGEVVLVALDFTSERFDLCAAELAER